MDKCTDKAKFIDDSFEDCDLSCKLDYNPMCYAQD